jgi:hypothetical protein
MELKIVKPEARTPYETFGITPERMEEMATKMQTVIGELPETFDVTQAWVGIASFCDTPEELVVSLEAFNGYLERSLKLIKE